MKPVLYAILVLTGLTLIGIAVAIMRSVDDGLNLNQVKPREQFGFATAPTTALESSTISTEFATRLTVLGSATAVLGATNIMIGSLLFAVHILVTRSKPSRLGTNLRA